MNKRALLLAGLLALALIAGVAGCGGEEAAPTLTPRPITLKLVTSSPDNGLAADSYHYFADLVEEYTGGRVEVDVYSGSQLFPAADQVEAVVTGAIDIYADATYWLTTHVPDLMVSYIDGLWEGYEHAYAVLEDSEVPRIFTEKIEQARPVKVLGFLPAGAVTVIMNSVRETQELGDLDGLKISSAPGAPPLPIYDYCGMAGVPIALEEAPAAFFGGVLDAVHYPPDTIARFGMYETGKHILYRTTMFPLYGIIANGDSWQSLPSDIQDIILNQVMPETYDFNKVNYRQGQEADMRTIEEAVDTVHWATQEDIDAYVEFTLAHPLTITQMLFVDRSILEIVEELRPSRQ
jgi:TRAP-type C4-dicarboxylate transport system substrate-binding protein